MVYRQYPLYRFLDYCEDQASEKGLERRALDCGAGGSMPPLGLFLWRSECYESEYCKRGYA